jgi:2-C-methyl-D-erythritol 2,4-cyclodiphosphate synthase
MRIGQGFDAHRLTENRQLILGGVSVPHHKGLSGHSDADVLTHAICDAILGAAALGDLGTHFPDTDRQYKGISSLRLLSLVRNKIADIGFCVGNIDATVIAEQPKLAEFVPAMSKIIAETIGIETTRVSIKATTTEGMGFTGKGEGIAALAIALILEGSDHE